MLCSERVTNKLLFLNVVVLLLLFTKYLGSSVILREGDQRSIVSGSEEGVLQELMDSASGKLVYVGLGWISGLAGYQAGYRILK